MKSVLVSIIAIVSGFLALAGSESMNVGTSLPIAGQTYYLAGSGVSSSATSFSLTSFTIPQSGALINDSQISDTFYLTIEPGSRTRQEIVSCTTVTQNADGTATISGCTRGLSPMTPFTASTSLQFAHAGGSSVILSNPPQLYETVGFLDNDETITGTWVTTVTPTSANGLATKGYVDGVVNGGAVSLDSISIGATAGDTFATGTIVYYDKAQQRWEKADADVLASSTQALIGIAQGAGTDGSAISGGVLTRGYDTTQSGMTPGNTIYLSNTAGATSTSAGTYSVILGIANAAGVLYFDPVQLQMAGLGNVNTFLANNTFNANLTVNGTTTLATTTINGKNPMDTMILYSTTSAKSATDAGNVSYNVTIPANTLGSDGGIRVSGILSSFASNNGGNGPALEVSYGGTQMTNAAVTPDVSLTGMTGTFEVVLFATSTTAQRAWAGYQVSEGSGALATGNGGTAAVDSTQDQTLNITFNGKNTGDAVTVQAFIVEKLKF